MEQSSQKGASSVKADGMKKQPPQQKIEKRDIRRRDAVEAALRFKSHPEGRVEVIRFSRGQRIEHLVLIVSFFGLAITGLVQTYSASSVGSSVIAFLGGIASTRLIHHLFAIAFGSLFIYHAAVTIYGIFVLMRANKMRFVVADVRNFFEMMKLNLGLSKKYPRFDRYNFEEKSWYWFVILTAVIMGVTGLIQWFPVLVSQVLPGWTIPLARLFHRWEAILIVLVMLIWHTYQTLLRTRNISIFTGVMDLKKMQEEHPLELVYLKAASAAVNEQTWPVTIEIQLDEPQNGTGAKALKKEIEPVLEILVEGTVKDTDHSFEKEIENTDGN